MSIMSSRTILKYEMDVNKQKKITYSKITPALSLLYNLPSCSYICQLYSHFQLLQIFL